MKIEKLSHRLIVIALIIVFLIYSKSFLIPIILSIVLWYLINAVNSVIRFGTDRIWKIPHGLTLGFSAILVFFIIFWIGSLVGQTINSMVSTASENKINFQAELARIMLSLGLDESISFNDVFLEFDVGEYLKNILNSFRSMAQQFLLIILYTLFLLMEQHTFLRKIAALQWDADRKERMAKLMDKINKAVRTYIGVKFAASIATGALSFIVIKFAGLEFAFFWAFLIFVFNFIPTIGSIAATALPSLIALIQFETMRPFVIVLIGVGLIQLCIGAVLEPKLYGNSLNISPFVIIISLVLWGLLWGVAGMLLCVPITVIMINVFAQFPKTKPVAILLSQTGKLK